MKARRYVVSTRISGEGTIVSVLRQKFVLNALYLAQRVIHHCNGKMCLQNKTFILHSKA